MSYTDHADSLFDVGKPILGSTHQEARDNLVAVAEADDSGDKAPRVVSRALNLTTLSGSGTYNSASIDWVDMGALGYDIVFLVAAGDYVSTGVGSSSVKLEGSVNNSTWTTLQAIVTSSSADEDTTVHGSAIYDGNGGTQYRYYRLREDGDSDKEFTGSASAVFIGGDNS